MIRVLLVLTLFPVLAAAQLLPEALGEFTREIHGPHQPAEVALFREFGFEAAEEARYIAPDGGVAEVAAYRFHDDTGALAAYQWSQPSDGTPVAYGERAVQSGNRIVIHFGNYFVEMSGALPIDDNVELMLAYLPRVQMTADPPVLERVPADQLVPASQRHILGPVGLEKVAPEIPPSVAAFRFGTEAQFARYQTPEGELRLVLFDYPSSQIARGQISEFNKLTGLAKRVRSMVAFVPSPPSDDEAERLLAKVQYAVEVTMTPEQRANRHDNLGTLLLDIVLLCVVLIGLMIVGGALVAGTRLMAGRYAPGSILASNSDSELTRLNIEDFRRR